MSKVISTQKQLDALVKKGVLVGEEVIIESKMTLELKANLEVFGLLCIKTKVNMGSIWETNIVTARGNSTVRAWGNSTVRAWGNSTVDAWENSTVRARGNSTVRAWGNSTVDARENSTVDARENSTVRARENSTVDARENSTVRARGNSTVRAWGNSTVRARGNSTVRAWGNSTVRARENSTVRAWGNSTVRARGNSTVRARGNSTLSLFGFSVGIAFPNVKAKVESQFATLVTKKQVFKTKEKTIVYKKLMNNSIATLELPKGAVFQSEFNSKCRTEKAKVLKIESKSGEELETGYSSYDEEFVYKVGKTVSAPYDENIEECSTGIHFFLSRHEAENY